jgi:DNA-binding transcriptional ArsR family regulator
MVNPMADDRLQLDRAFDACAHPIRRGIIERLAGGEMTVGEATHDFPVSKPAISRHL